MRWLRYLQSGTEGFGALVGEAVQVHTGDLFTAPQATGQVVSFDDVQCVPPCRPGKILGLWNNVRAAADKNGWAHPAEPLWFLKAPSSLSARGKAIAAPASYDGRVAYEGELVIGRRATAVGVVDALSHVLGYTCTNDVTAVELISGDPSFAQRARAKSFNGFCALGPVIETAFDAAGASLRTLVGRRERQDYALSDMFFGPAELVSRLSHDMTLEPGDVILCGTSLGVLPMKPGTTVDVQIDGIGTLSNVYG